MGEEKGKETWRLPPQPSGAQAGEESELFRRAKERAQEIRERRDRELRAAIQWLASTWQEGKHCPYCDNPSWEVGTPVEIALADGTNMSPHVPVMCTKCGNTVLINAIRAGVWRETDQRE